MPEMEFHGQKQGEKVLLVLKQNAIVFLAMVLKVITLWLIIILLYKLSFYISWGWYSYVLSAALWLVIIGSLYMILTKWYTWANTVYLLTNDRVLSVEQLGWFNRVISEATLWNILFISHKVEGLMQTMFNFGSIHIRASGVVEEEIVLRNVSDPYEAQQTIVGAQQKITGRQATIKEEDDESKGFWKDRKSKPIIR